MNIVTRLAHSFSSQTRVGAAGGCARSLQCKWGVREIYGQLGQGPSADRAHVHAVFTTLNASSQLESEILDK